MSLGPVCAAAVVGSGFAGAEALAVGERVSAEMPVACPGCAEPSAFCSLSSHEKGPLSRAPEFVRSDDAAALSGGLAGSCGAERGIGPRGLNPRGPKAII